MDSIGRDHFLHMSEEVTIDASALVFKEGDSIYYENINIL